MWPWGHVAVAYLAWRGFVVLTGKEFDEDIPILLLVVGSLFPDLIDKPLAWYFGILPTGRSLVHSLVVLIPVCLIIYFLLNKYHHGESGIAFSIGAVSHVIVDAIPILWDEQASADFLLWPILAVEPYENGPPTIQALLLSSLTDPYFLFEFFLLGVAILVWKYDGYPGFRIIHEKLNTFELWAIRVWENKPGK